MSQDLFQAPDYFGLDELLTEEHKLIRDAARDWVKKEVSPIIEEACQKAIFPKQILKLPQNLSYHLFKLVFVL